MTTAQQLGLVGNSVLVQALPTASAETFGQGNRYYTLIGQQEGYITGHTYHTIVANDMYSWEDVAGGNYNMLDNIPVINQDLTASGFTPVANTYYRHTGTTTATFTQGVIYLYDTAYHKLGESGGGTTLNKYTYTANLSSPSFAIMNTIHLIAQNAARYSASMEIRAKLSDGKSVILNGAVLLNSEYYGYNGVLYSSTNYISPIYVEDGGSQIKVIGCCIKGGAISSFTETSSIKLTVVYYNDTEITYQ